MILGVDHVALSSSDITRDARCLEAFGYRQKFAARDAPNQPAKRVFLREYRPAHSLAYCVGEEGVAIELVQHSAALAEGASPYHVLFGACPAPSIKLGDADHEALGSTLRAVLGTRDPVAVVWQPLGAQLWWDASGERTSRSVRAVVALVPDVEAATAYWTDGLGCELIRRSSRWAHVAVRSPVRAWCLDVVLALSSSARPRTYLDAPGFPVLAMLSSKIAQDGERLRKLGATEACEFEFEAGARQLCVGVFRGPDGNLVELIEIQR